jgi:Zn-dependent peptidase ImmA (M78 family)
MTPVRPRYAKIEQLADALLNKLGITGPAVPIMDVIKSQKIAVHSVDLAEVSGLVLREGAKVYIGVNKRHSLTRRRFTLAHELAHALLHDGKKVHYDEKFRVDYRSEISSQGTDVEEMEANFFAACVLMPRKFLEVEPTVRELDAVDSSNAVALLAGKYQVSAHSMSIRLGAIAHNPSQRTR